MVETYGMDRTRQGLKKESRIRRLDEPCLITYEIDAQDEASTGYSAIINPLRLNQEI